MTIITIGLVGSGQPAEVAFSVYDRLRHIHEAPLKNFRRSFWWVRKTFFTKSRTPTPSFVVEMSKPEVIRLFGRRHFEPGWEMSYNYHGEVLNIRRVIHVAEGRYDWWQVHIRGFNHPEGIELTAHYETEPAEHPDAHINLSGLETAHGMEVVKGILEEENIDFERLEPEERPGIDADSIEAARRSG